MESGGGGDKTTLPSAPQEGRPPWAALRPRPGLPCNAGRLPVAPCSPSGPGFPRGRPCGVSPTRRRWRGGRQPRRAPLGPTARDATSPTGPQPRRRRRRRTRRRRVTPPPRACRAGTSAAAPDARDANGVREAEAGKRETGSSPSRPNRPCSSAGRRRPCLC